MRFVSLLLAFVLLSCAPPIGEVCADDSECGGGSSCQARYYTHLRQCVSDCSPDAPECPAGECVGYVCSLPCEADAECPDGTLCGQPHIGVGLVCMAACESDADCREATPTCNAGRCES